MSATGIVILCARSDRLRYGGVNVADVQVNRDRGAFQRLGARAHPTGDFRRAGVGVESPIRTARSFVISLPVGAWQTREIDEALNALL